MITPTIPEPLLERIGTGYRVTWPQEEIRLHFTRIHGDSLRSEVRLEGIKDKEHGWSYVHAQYPFPLLGVRGHKELAVVMESRWPLKGNGYTWTDILSKTTKVVIEAYRTGEAEVELVITDDDKITPPQGLIPPLLYENTSTMLFAYGGIGKTWVAQTLALMAALPWRDNPFGLSVPQRYQHVLYLDYEDNVAIFKWRLRRLVKGNDLHSAGIIYRRCFRPFVDDYETIESIVARRSIDIIIVDSVGMAASRSYDLSKDTRVATEMYECLRQLNVSSLLIHHTSKSTPEHYSDKHPFGSVYFENEARMVFHLVPSEISNGLELAFFNTKANNMPKVKPFAWRLTFPDAGAARWEMANVEDIPEAQDHLTIHERIGIFLRDNGPHTVAEIATALNKNTETIRKILKRFEVPMGRFRRIGERWAFLPEEEKEI